LHRALAGEPHSYSIDKRYRKKDGTLFWVNVTNKLVASPTGEPKYFISVIQDISVVQDITERKSLQEQLLQAQKMEAIGRLAGGVAHDFNNLLTVITGYCGMILRRLQNEDPIRHEMGEIKMAGERATALTAKLLAFSRRQVPQRKVTDLTTVMIDVQELLIRLIGEDIQLIATVEPGIGLVNVDEAQIGQVIMNLAVNARDAMPKGGTLAIQLSNIGLDEEYARSHFGVWPGRYVMLSVKDTGCGMDAETQARMFDPFFTTKEQGKGTGLGLSMVYGIVKEHGGHVGVDSLVGVGTTIRIYLPRVEGIVETSAKELGEAKQKCGSETILVVEDDNQLRQMVVHILQAEGYTVLEAENGDQALLLSRSHGRTIDLVVTDIVMPGMSGRTLAEKITSSGVCSRVLFMSGHSGDTTGPQEAMVSDVPMLTKPFSPEQLLERVRSALETINEAETGR
jgi:signal transduction histidine kinase/ActR/RegA family two-component response regulator